MMIDQPWPTSPIRLSADTVTPSRKTSLTSIASPIVRMGRTSTPDADNGTTNTERPWCRDDDGSVRTSANPMSAQCPSVIHVFWPSMTHVPSCLLRRRDCGHRAMSLPASGSLSNWHHMCSLRLIGGSSVRFCSSEPKCSRTCAAQVHLVDRPRGTGAQDLLADDAVVHRMVIGAPAVFDRPVGTDESGVEQGWQTTCAAALPASASTGARWPSRASMRRRMLGDERAHPVTELRPAGLRSAESRATLTSRTPPRAAARLERAVPNRTALVNTRRSSWCKGYSQVNPMPPDSCMHSSTAAVAFAATNACATADSATRLHGRRTPRRAPPSCTTARAFTSKTRSSTRRCCTAWKLAIGDAERDALPQVGGQPRKGHRSGADRIGTEQQAGHGEQLVGPLGGPDQHARRSGDVDAPRRSVDVQQVVIEPSLLRVGYLDQMDSIATQGDEDLSLRHR